MKRKIPIILIICFVKFNIYAQEFKAGVNLGLSTSQVSGDNLSGFHKAGVIIGGFVNRDINNNLSLQLEMTFIQKGSSNTKKNNLIADIYLDYLEVPLLIIYQQSESIALEVGIHTSALVNGYYHDIYGRLENQTRFNNFDIGALIGMSYKINNKLSLNTRLTNSIIPIAEHASGQTYRFNKGKYNTGLSFILKYQL
jgi:hypothetical protein